MQQSSKSDPPNCDCDSDFVSVVTYYVYSKKCVSHRSQSSKKPVQGYVLFFSLFEKAYLVCTVLNHGLWSIGLIFLKIKLFRIPLL